MVDSLIELKMTRNGAHAHGQGEWSIPVTIELSGHRRFVTIESAFQAANCILDNWPFDEGEAMDNALEVCFAACKGLALPDHARHAFLEAVCEAKLYVRPHFGGHWCPCSPLQRPDEFAMNGRMTAPIC